MKNYREIAQWLRFEMQAKQRAKAKLDERHTYASANYKGDTFKAALTDAQQEYIETIKTINAPIATAIEESRTAKHKALENAAQRPMSAAQSAKLAELRNREHISAGELTAAAGLFSNSFGGMNALKEIARKHHVYLSAPDYETLSGQIDNAAAYLQEMVTVEDIYASYQTLQFFGDYQSNSTLESLLEGIDEPDSFANIKAEITDRKLTESERKALDGLFAQYHTTESLSNAVNEAAQSAEIRHLIELHPHYSEYLQNGTESL